MPAEALKCTNCGAVVTAEGASFCAFCGAKILLPPPPVPAEIRFDAPERFAAVEAHADYPELMQRTPETHARLGGTLVAAVFLVIFIGFGLFIASSGGGRGGLLCFFLVFPLVGVGLLMRVSAKAARFRSAPVERSVELVLDERTEVSGGGRNSSASTTYHALLQSKDGRRREVEADREVAGKIARGDIGVAYVKDGVLVEFAVVRV